MRERTLLFGHPKSLIGILTSPSSEGAAAPLPGIVIPNAGILHRVGPNRIHVKIARRLAEAGFHTVRFDLSGIGDSRIRSGSVPFEKRALHETREAMEHLRMKTGIETFVLIGICSGADFAFHVAREDESVTGVFMINGYLLPGEILSELHADATKSTEGRYYSGRLFNPGSWMRFVTGKSDVKRILRFVARKVHPKRSSGALSEPDVDYMSLWNPLLDRHVDIALVFSEGSVALDVFRLTFESEFDAISSHGTVTLRVLSDTDHVFTLLWSQQELIDMILQWVSSDERGWMKLRR